jgi:hypothetical protein
MKSLATINKMLKPHGLTMYKASGYFYFMHPSITPPNSIYTNSVKNITQTDIENAISEFLETKKWLMD